MSSFFYALKQGLKNIVKNKMFSIASIATMAACIFLFGVMYMVVANLSATMKHIEKTVSITVFFDEELEEDQIKIIGNQILADKQADISEMKFTSAAEAWEEFKETYFKGHEELADAFVDDNPLEHSANYQIKLHDIEKQQSMAQYLKTVTGVREVKVAENVAETFVDMNKMGAYVSGAIIIILLSVSIFLISNTISVGISVRKEEIGIMRLVGASDFLVRAPFIIEGIVIGLIGAGIPLVILYFAYDNVIQYVAKQFNIVGELLAFVTAGELFHVLVPVALGLAVGIGLIGSFWTVHKHLKV